jgi:hypothetical protein
MFSRLAAFVAAGVLVMSGLATGTANASTAPTVTATPECGKVTITVANDTQTENLRLQYQVDRHWPQSVPVSTTEDTVKVVDFREDSGRHWVRYRLSSANEWSKVGPVKTNCQPDRVRADAPSVVQPECDATRGKLTIPSDRGVFYKVRVGSRPYRDKPAGEYDVRPGVYWVKAYAKDGYELHGRSEWRLVVEPAEACPTPTPTPTATDEPTPDPTPTVEPTVEPEPTQEPEPEPQPTVTETNTHVIVINDTRVPVRVDTGLGGLAK